MNDRLLRLLVLLTFFILGLPHAAQAASYALTVTKDGTGAVTSTPTGINCGTTCTANFVTGSTVALAAAPGSGYGFSAWSGACTGSGACNVTMSAAKSVKASFVVAYALTVTKAGAGSGTVTSSPAGINCGSTCSKTFNTGSSITLTASPTTGSSFAGWSGACTGLATTCTVAMSAAKSVTATFGLPTTTYKYDANGNLTQVTDPIGNVHQATYDALDRPNLVKEPSATTAGSTAGQIVPTYDGQDQVVGIKDPRSLSTTYSVDGLGNLTGLTSPDTGTASYTYDAAGNLLTRTDARGKQTLYTYDALNRLTQINPGDQIITLTWDSCTNGKGRLCQIIDGTANTLYTYDLQGRVTAKSVTLGSLNRATTYTYNTAGQLTGLTTPAGQAITYTWSNGKVSAVKVNGSTLLSAVRYEPFGPLAGWTWGNGQSMSRSYDLAGRLRRFSLGLDLLARSDSRTLAYDAAGRIIGLTPAYDTSLSLSFGYDGLDRLSQAKLGSPVTSTQSYAYDAAGNRTQDILNGSTVTYTTPGTSNRLATLSGAKARSYAYDASGNITGDGSGLTHTYDNTGRRVKSTLGGQTWTYAYDALGERLKKAGSTTTIYAYDEQGHLLGEYDASGKLIQETVWLGDTPVATLRLPAGANSGTANIFYVHADHLNTPRRITRPADNKVMWQWESEPFGDTPPNQNPQGQGTFVYALRFPGQVFDPETGLSYNFFRDYDSATGRYRESDPIGLAGGSWSTYGYVNGNPVSKVDPRGLDPGDVFRSPDAAARDAGAYSRSNCRNGFECGGWIFPKNSGYTYNYIQAKRFPSKLTHDEMYGCKPDNTVAAWHKHPWWRDMPPPDDDLPMNQFSDSDMSHGVPIYLIAPSGRDKVWSPGGGERVL